MPNPVGLESEDDDNVARAGPSNGGKDVVENRTALKADQGLRAAHARGGARRHDDGRNRTDLPDGRTSVPALHTPRAF